LLQHYKLRNWHSAIITPPLAATFGGVFIYMKEIENGINVVSTFDGMGCLYIALKELGIKVNKYFAIEVDKHAIKTTTHNFPDIIHLGDITKVTKEMFGGLDIHVLGGGSPC
jgi:predicted RNA methylase